MCRIRLQKETSIVRIVSARLASYVSPNFYQPHLHGVEVNTGYFLYTCFPNGLLKNKVR